MGRKTGSDSDPLHEELLERRHRRRQALQRQRKAKTELVILLKPLVVGHDSIWDEVVRSEAELVYLAPEALEGGLKEFIKDCPVSLLVVDENLNDTEDLRADWTNSLTVAMSERLALKTSLQVLFDNQPSLTAVPLGDSEVLTPLDKVDSIFTVALVVNF